ncbi:bifunctional lysylphosphatidylglycerol synthetase/lysine--tRNA ligase LysX [Calidifontibacter indicus]|uniref:bifunctional lysylphosphatidylglycerol synthetase/lysine--tRNA ligase LysX n=1 Tax=Calidifontibacter indicus TaxID=419650 RepID=UPI003D7078D5
MIASKLLKGSINSYGGPTDATRERVGLPETVATWLGRLLLIAALWSFASLILPLRIVGLVVSDVLSLLGLPAEPSLFIAVLTLVLAGAVRRRLRAAHTVVVVFMALTALSSAAMALTAVNDPDSGLGARLHGMTRDYLEIRSGVRFNVVALVLQVAVLVLVLLSRRAFPAKLQKGSLRVAFGVLVGGLAVSAAVAFVLTLAFPHRLVGIGERARWSIRSAFGVETGPGTPSFHGHVGPHWVYVIAGLISAVALVFALLAMWRAGHSGAWQSADDELAVRELLLRHGEDDSLGYFATRRDKEVVFSPDRRAVLTYRNEGSVSVASADPIGDRGSWPAAIEAWRTQSRERGLYCAVLSSSEAATQEYVAAGLRAFPLGDEAIIDADTFSLRGRSMRPVRQAVTRISRAGYTAQVRRHGDLNQDELAEIERLATEWRGNETERGFSMALNRLGDPADARCVLITARDAHGVIRGFLSFVPWGVRGVSLDLMRRDRSAENGLNEYMVAKLLELGGALGIRRVSLNFAVFRNVFSTADQVGAGPITKLTDAALSFASRFYQLETLYRSNDKYRPTWVPRMLCYDPMLTVARAGLAMGVAEGFVRPIGPRFLIGPRPEEIQPPRTDPGFVEAVRAQEELLLVPEPDGVVLGDQQRVRREKLDLLRASGQEGYPVSVPRTHRVGELLERYPDLPADTVTGEEVSVSGRVHAWRDLGGVTFAVLDDEGHRIQVMVTGDGTPAPARGLWRRAVDLGDLVSVTGRVATSRKGELSVLVASWVMASKCLSPMPGPGSQLSDEVRARSRSLELLVDPTSLQMLQRRFVGVRTMREVFAEKGFTEVETPMLQSVHGGATARPFKTHINAYNMGLYLRIAPELYLKRLAVGGMQKVFELNRNFRNEGGDATHNPEFTSLEAYQAYGDYNTMRDLMREVVLRTATAVNGRPVAYRPDGSGGSTEIDLDRPWPVVTAHDAVSKAVGETVTSSTPLAEMVRICRDHGVGVPAGAGAGKLVMELYEALVEKQTTFPTFYQDFPVEVSPLARPGRNDPLVAEQWDLVAFGTELGTAYSELIDPIDQRDRLTRQSLAAAAGDPEAMELDEAFLAALELGMPPTGGLGFGVDRLIMMLLGTNIRSTLAFPFVRPAGNEQLGR